MKHYISIICFALSMAVACGPLDNYAGPDSSISGTIVNDLTGEVVWQPVNSDAGLRVLLTQQDWVTETSEPQVVYGTEDGKFRTIHMFSGEYMVDFTQSNFFPPESIPVSVKGDTQVEIRVTPYCMIDISDAVFENRGARAKVKIRRSWDWYKDNRNCKITKLGLYCHVTSHVDQESGNHIGYGIIDLSSIDDVQILTGDLTGDRTYDMNLIVDGAKFQRYSNMIKANGGTLYLRAGVATSVNGEERYNYSDVVPVCISSK